MDVPNGDLGEPIGEPREAEAQQQTEAPETVAAGGVVSGSGDRARRSDPTEDARLRALLEAVVYVTEEPLTLEQIAAGIGQPRERVEKLLEQLVAEYDKPEHGLTIRVVAGGYKMATKAEHHESVRSFVKSLKPPLKLSLPALETLAVVAYKQPVTSPEIMEIRGVQGAGVLKTLLDRKLIAAAGRKNVIGKPILYKTTKEFLIQFGLKDLSELPSLKEFEDIRRMAISDGDMMLPLGSAQDAGAGLPDEIAASAESASEAKAAPAGEPAEATGSVAEAKAAPAGEPGTGGHGDGRRPRRQASPRRRPKSAAEAEAAPEVGTEGDTAPAGEPAAEAESVAGAKAAPEVNSGTDADTAPAGELAAEAESETEAKAAPEVGSGTEADTASAGEPAAEAESVTEAMAAQGVESGTEADTAQAGELAAEAESETEAKAAPEVDSGIDVDTATAGEPAAEAGSVAEAKAAPEVDSGTEADTAPAGEPTNEAEPEPEAETAAATEAGHGKS